MHLDTPKRNCSFSMGTCYWALTAKEGDYWLTRWVCATRAMRQWGRRSSFMTWEVYSYCAETHPWSLRLSPTRHWNSRDPPARQRLCSAAAHRGVGLSSSSRSGHSHLMWRTRDNKTTWPLECFWSSAKSVSHPRSWAVKAMGCSSQPATIPKILPRLATSIPGLRGKGEGCVLPAPAH